MKEMEKNKGVVGVRKGAWTKEEDKLLKKCVQTYGEGKWHLVPLRTGLNRCRKSCRLRWLNYLRPNLKRGIFNQDEIDLIVRLHNLLGNRWTWIAGRVPGRTANDIKNFWNTHFHKKSTSPATAVGESSRRAVVVKTITANNIIRPRPRTLSNININNNIINCPSDKVIVTTSKLTKETIIINDKDINNKLKNNNVEELLDDQSINRWWGDLLEMTEKLDDGEFPPPLLFSDQQYHPLIETPPLLSPGLPPPHHNYNNNNINDYCLNNNGLCLDVDVWELLSFRDY
ncbi:hypothetical protein ABFX02_08G064700 [Erythranthe guttata]